MKHIFLFFLILLSSIGWSQRNSIYVNHSFRPYDRYMYNPEHRFHTSIKPFDMDEVNKIVLLDTLFPLYKGGKLLERLLSKNLIELKTEELNVQIKPLMNFEISRQQNEAESGWINARGVLLNATIMDKIIVSSSFYEIQSKFNDYRQDKIDELGDYIVPGQNRGRVFKDNGLDYAFSDAYISYLPAKTVKFQLGHGKHFIGDGYRSLLLSDNAINYPYLKITSTFWNIKYVNLWSQHSLIDDPLVPNKRFRKKWNAMHYLDWSVNNWLNIGLFETIIWQNEDSLGYRGFEINYLNPVIFLRPVEFTIGSPDNVLIGLTGKITLLKKHFIYGQFILDEFVFEELKANKGFWGNKYGIQGGYKTYDLLGIQNLDIQSEVNAVRPFTYSHFHESQNYGHISQPLAHPRGSNFYESVSFIRYNVKRWHAELKFQCLVYGTDSANTNYGNDIFKVYDFFKVYGDKRVDYGHSLAELGYKHTLISKQLQLSYLLNPKNNLNISFGISYRTHSSQGVKTSSPFYSISLNTRLNNYYYDY